MIYPSARAVTLAAILTAVAVCGTSTANAQKRSDFNGDWTVTIRSSSGECGSNSMGVRIQDGAVIYMGGMGVKMSGSVHSGGSVSVSVSDRESGRSAHGSGKLNAQNGTGRGHWSGRGPTGSCGGSWSAQRSG